VSAIARQQYIKVEGFIAAQGPGPVPAHLRDSHYKGLPVNNHDIVQRKAITPSCAI